MELLKRLLKEEEGQGIVEYALIVALVVFGIWVLIGNSEIGNSVANVFTQVGSELDKSTTP